MHNSLTGYLLPRLQEMFPVPLPAGLYSSKAITA